MSLAWHCDNPNGCDSWIKTDGNEENYGFIKISYGFEHHFCSWDCVIQYGAYKPAIKIIPFGA